MELFEGFYNILGYSAEGDICGWEGLGNSWLQESA